MKIVLVWFGIKKGCALERIYTSILEIEKITIQELKRRTAQVQLYFQYIVYCKPSIHLSLSSPLPHLLSHPLNSLARLVTFTQLLYLRKIVAMETMSLKDTLHYIYLVFVNLHKRKKIGPSSHSYRVYLDFCFG